MGRRRRGAGLGDLVELLFEITGMIWQVGAVTTVALVVLAGMSLRWAQNANAGLAATHFAPLAETIGWVLYGFPLMPLVLAWLFGVQTIAAYQRQNRF